MVCVVIEQLSNNARQLFSERLLEHRQKELPRLFVQVGVFRSTQQRANVHRRTEWVFRIPNRGFAEQKRNDQVQIAQQLLGVARDLAGMPLDHGVAFDRYRIHQRQRFGIERARGRLHPPHGDFLKVLVLRFLQARHERVMQIVELRGQMPLHQR